MLLRAIADRICATTFEGLPGIAVATAREGILDTIGVTLAGAREDTTAVVTRALRRTAAAGPALIFGHGTRLDVLYHGVPHIVEKSNYLGYLPFLLPHRFTVHFEE